MWVKISSGKGRVGSFGEGSGLELGVGDDVAYVVPSDHFQGPFLFYSTSLFPSA